MWSNYSKYMTNGLGLIAGDIFLCIISDNLIFLHQAWLTMSKIPFYYPNLFIGFLHNNSPFYYHCYLIMISILLISIFIMKTSIIYYIIKHTYFTNKMEVFQTPFHTVMHLIRRNPLKNYDLLLLSFQVTCIYFKFIIIVNYNNMIILIILIIDFK